MSSDQQAHGLDKDRLRWILTQMVRIREFEERVKRTFEEHPGAIPEVPRNPRSTSTRCIDPPYPSQSPVFLP